MTICKTAEGQSRKIVWEKCPVKRPLLSVAKITKAGHSVHLGEDRAFIKHLKTGQVTQLRRVRNVWVLDIWIKKPDAGNPDEAPKKQGFPRQGP